MRQTLLDIYGRLYSHYGRQHWWPAEEAFEVIIGAILTPQTSWGNVAKAIANLKAAKVLSPPALRALSQDEVATLIRPCGYYHTKTRRLKSFLNWLGENCNDDLARLFDSDIITLRRRLLSVYGIGEETADAIILYAAGKPVFVIDAYTRRFADRFGLTPNGRGYADYQSLFMNNLPGDSRLFNEYHALLVQLGKTACRKHPLCPQCCLRDICHTAATLPY